MGRGDRYVVLGLAHVRSPWFRDVGRWSTSASVPVEFLKVLSVEELRARLGSGRAYSAALIDGSLPGVDRDLVDAATHAGCAVVVVDDGRAARDWRELGASAVLPAGFGRDELLEALRTAAMPIGSGEAAGVADDPVATTGGWRGRLVAVTGAGGSGASTVAMALAQGLGADPRYSGLVLLADLALDADQAMLHDARDVVPGVQELVEAHRTGQPSVQDIRSLTHAFPDRQYSLLLGLRRHRDWAAVRPRAFAAALDGTRRCYRAVVADVTGDLEGADECGSVDVEERNTMARTALSAADAVALVAPAGPRGLHRLVRLVAAAIDHGVAVERIVPIVNRAPRTPRGRAEVTATLAVLTRPLTAGGPPLAPPVQLPDRRRLDELIQDGARLPGALVAPVTAAVAHTLEQAPTPTATPTVAPSPVPVAPGSLGSSWPEEDER